MGTFGELVNIISVNYLSFRVLKVIASVDSGTTQISELADLVDELAPTLDRLSLREATENELTTLRTQSKSCSEYCVAMRYCSTRQRHVREDDIQQIQESPEFQELDAYSKAVVTALLEQYLTSKNIKEAACCFTSARQLMSHIRMSVGAENVQDVGSPSNQAPTAKHERILEADGTLLELLQYRFMENRKATITEASASSCQWVYDAPVDGKWTSLPEWLAHGSGVYLIVGNEGSGKSTMMKYISTHEKMLTYLRRWADQSSLATAAFFFWRNGTRLEKSEEGLWRSLLYSALEQQTQLMPIVFPREWALLYSSACGEDSMSNSGLGVWQVRELRQAFRRLVTQNLMPSKLFILIDGLDEYQNHECGDNFTTIVEFITESVTISANTKALISSRPLEAFDRSNLQPSVTLHELNHGDIERYVRDAFEQDRPFQTDCATDNEMAETVIRYILNESKGVFLWAVLSTRAVKSKLAREITLSEIALNLPSELAPALGDLYRSIWEGMDGTAKTQASQILQIMLAGKEIKRSWLDNDEEALRLIDLALGLGDPDETINARVTPWRFAQSDVQDKCNSIATGFMKTWPGFITIANPHKGERKWNPSLRIRYCHRSVPEFFSEHHASLLLDATRELSFQFCPRMAHLKAAVHQLKVLPKPLLNEPLRVLWALVTTALLAANRIDRGDPFDPGDSGDPSLSHDLDTRKYHDLLAELDRTMEHHHKILQQDIDNNYLPTVLQDHRGTVAISDRGRDSRLKAAMHWSNFHSDPAYAHPRNWNDSFLSLAVQFGLRNYVESPAARLRIATLVVAEEILITPDVVNMLLAHGARPNHKFEGRTCWEGALQWQYNTFAKREGRVASETGGTTEDIQRVAEARAEIFGILLKEGADVRATITTPKNEKISAKEVLRVSLHGWAKDETIEALLAHFPT
ncbi:P-loop containing nucleoside triphosphate hydrolase [Fusarium austroafricanum]|uniref:P-loop containing nucleoside triphosphate hydrolase n=1 Tax=Fusarium austroafricanum TaxID=2364996 RepID=A0A8H4KU97_9HYPO|nr:P-loop containing nucleoside triphosphate hydrolase [Fusarium austroafricanum]